MDTAEVALAWVSGSGNSVKIAVAGVTTNLPNNQLGMFLCIRRKAQTHGIASVCNQTAG
jgi:hypothetical protein